MKVAFGDWLELLGIDVAINGLLAGNVTLSDARSQAENARDTWPSVSQDYIAVLDQLDPFFDEVEGVIEEQREIVDQFNSIVGEFGLGIDQPVDRLLTQADIDEMREQGQELAAALEANRIAMQFLEDQIQDLAEQLDELLTRAEEGDPFAEEEIADLAEELEGLVDAMETEGCLPS